MNPPPSATAGDAAAGTRNRPGILAAILAAGLLLRLAYSAAAQVLTFDSATVPLMALNILDGHWPLFFYGQNYMGALEAYLAAPMVALFGVSDLAPSLAPILLSLVWILAAYLLFREIDGETAGLTAAAVAAFPGYYVVWLNVNNNGGYAPVLALGTMALWLCVRIALRTPPDRTPWGATMALGAVSALGIWSNLSVAPYLMTGAVFLTLFLIRRRFAPPLIRCFLVGAAVAACGFVPGRFNPTGALTGSLRAEFVFVGEHLADSWRALWQFNLPHMIFWDAAPDALGGRLPAVAAAAYPAMLAVLAAAGLLYLLRLAGSARTGRMLPLALPLVFGLFFSLLYFPHRFSPLDSPRYVLNGWTMLLMGAWALAMGSLSGRWRAAKLALLGVWIAAQLAGNALFMDKMRPVKQKRIAHQQGAVALAAKCGLDTVLMTGGMVFGFKGQILTYRSANRIRFVSIFNERCQPSAQAAETSRHSGIMVESQHRARLAASLDLLGAQYRLAATDWVALAYDIRPPPRAAALVPAAELTVRLDGAGPDAGAAAMLVDRHRETVVRFDPAANRPSVVEIDLGRVRRLDSLWLYAPGTYQSGLPEGLHITASTDGASFHTRVRAPDFIPCAYTSGSDAYLLGYFGIQQVQLAGASARYLRVEFTRAQRRSGGVTISEIYVLEASGRPADSPRESAKAVVAALRDQSVDFTVADRWLSGRIVAALPPPGIKGPYPALPRSNPFRFGFTRAGRVVVPRPGLALAPAAETAEECIGLLTEAYGRQAVAKVLDCGAYRLVVCGRPLRRPPPDRRLLWNGHTLVTTANPDSLWEKR